MKALNELEYIFPLGVGANPDGYTRDFCRLIYQHPMTWKQRMKVREDVSNLIADVEADMLCWLGMNKAWKGRG